MTVLKKPLLPRSPRKSGRADLRLQEAISDKPEIAAGVSKQERRRHQRVILPSLAQRPIFRHALAHASRAG
jgi:hypothetical protein